MTELNLNMNYLLHSLFQTPASYSTHSLGRGGVRGNEEERHEDRERRDVVDGVLPRRRVGDEALGLSRARDHTSDSRRSRGGTEAEPRVVGRKEEDGKR